jgi:hypothetical protein
MLRLLRRCVLVGAALFATACLSPTLPLPPPDRPDVSAPDESGLVRLQGLAAPQAEVIALNHSNHVIAGQVTGDDSRYDFTIKAAVGDYIEVFYIQGADESPTVRVTVPEK